MRNFRKILFLLIIFTIVYIVFGTVFNYYCYNKTFVSVLKIFPVRTFLQALKLIKSSSNIYFKTVLIKYIVYYQILPVGLYFVFIFLYFTERTKIKPSSENEKATINGTASWGNWKDYKNTYLFSWNKIPPVVLGQSYDAVSDVSNLQNVTTKTPGKMVVGCYPYETNIMTIGSTGSMKGVSTIIPTLLSYRDSVIVYDPAKENFNISAGYRQSFGRVQYFDPTDINSTMHFNALDWIRRTEDYVTSDIDNLCSILIPTNEKDMFFSQNARNLLSVYISYILLFYNKEKQNLKEVTNISVVMQSPSYFYHRRIKKRIAVLQKKMQNNISVSEKNEILQNLEYWDNYLCSLSDAKISEQERIWKEEQEQSGMVVFINRLLSDFKAALDIPNRNDAYRWKKALLQRVIATASRLKIIAVAEQTMGGIEGEITSNLNFFAETTIARLTSDTTFCCEEINKREKPFSLYLCIPNSDTERCKVFVRLFLSSVIKSLSSEDYNQKKRTHHTLFIIDEFPQLKRIDEIVKAISFVRKYGISFILVFQSIAQLEADDCYGKYDTQTLRANSKVLDIKQVGSLEDAQWISNQLGKKTVLLSNESKNIKKYGEYDGKRLSLTVRGRFLLNETELQQLPADEEILLINQTKPLHIKKFQYYQHPLFVSRAKIKYNAELEKFQLTENYVRFS